MTHQTASKVHLSDLDIANTVLDLELQGLNSIRNILNSNFTDIINVLYSAKSRVVVSGIGKSGHIAKKFVATLASTGTPAMFLHPAEALHGDLGMVTQDDIMILLSNSGESTELNCVIEYCKRFAIPTIAICRNANSTLAKASDYQFVLANIDEASAVAAPTTSTLMMLSLCDIISVVLHERRGFTKSDFKLLHPGGKIGAQLLKASDLMHTGDKLPLVKTGSRFADAILEMTKKRLGCVAVEDNNGKFLGMLTDGDLRRHIGLDLSATIVDEIMTTQPISASSEMYAAELLHIMNEKKITNLFVIDERKVLGAIHLHDLLNARIA